MKKLLVVLLVALGLQTQAQINICDSIELSISPTSTWWAATIETNLTPNNFPISYVQSYDWTSCLMCGTNVGTDTSSIISFFTDTTEMYSICLTSVFCDSNLCYTCVTCDTLVWNNGSWMMMSMMQQPYFCCDSITYWTDQSQGFNVGLDTTGIVHNPDSMTVYWGVCTNGLCYADQGMYAYFPQVTTADTVKLNYDVYLYENGVLEVCSIEDWLVFDQNTYSWVLLNMNPTSINEITFNKINDGRMYDMLGREITNVTLGTMYIKNGKKYIRTR